MKKAKIRETPRLPYAVTSCFRTRALAALDEIEFKRRTGRALGVIFFVPGRCTSLEPGHTSLYRGRMQAQTSPAYGHATKILITSRYIFIQSSKSQQHAQFWARTSNQRRAKGCDTTNDRSTGYRRDSHCVRASPSAMQSVAAHSLFLLTVYELQISHLANATTLSSAPLTPAFGPSRSSSVTTLAETAPSSKAFPGTCILRSRPTLEHGI